MFKVVIFAPLSPLQSLDMCLFAFPRPPRASMPTVSAGKLLCHSIKTRLKHHFLWEALPNSSTWGGITPWVITVDPSSVWVCPASILAILTLPFNASCLLLRLRVPSRAGLRLDLCEPRPSTRPDAQLMCSDHWLNIGLAECVSQHFRCHSVVRLSSTAKFPCFSLSSYNSAPT